MWSVENVTFDSADKITKGLVAVSWVLTEVMKLRDQRPRTFISHIQ